MKYHCLIFFIRRDFPEIWGLRYGLISLRYGVKIFASTQEAAARPPPHTNVGGGWVVLRPQSRFLAIFLKKFPSGRKRPCFVMARLCSFVALLWFAHLFDLCGLRLKIRCYRHTPTMLLLCGGCLSPICPKEQQTASLM